MGIDIGSPRIRAYRVKLDSTDHKITQILFQDGRTSLLKLAEEAGVSTSTIRRRLAKLKKTGVFKVKGGIDLKAIGYKIASFTASLRDNIEMESFEKTLINCPRVLKYYQDPEANILNIFIWGENLETLQSTAAQYQKLVDFEMGDFNYLGWTKHGDVLVRLHQDHAECNCGLNCLACQSYQNNMCSGCPHTKHYKHSIL